MCAESGLCMVKRGCNKPLYEYEDIVLVAHDADDGDRYWVAEPRWKERNVQHGILLSRGDTVNASRAFCGQYNDFCTWLCERCARKEGYLW
jgi:hypothetical protein